MRVCGPERRRTKQQTEKKKNPHRRQPITNRSSLRLRHERSPTPEPLSPPRLRQSACCVGIGYTYGLDKVSELTDRTSPNLLSILTPPVHIQSNQRSKALKSVRPPNPPFQLIDSSRAGPCGAAKRRMCDGQRAKKASTSTSRAGNSSRQKARSLSSTGSINRRRGQTGHGPPPQLVNHVLSPRFDVN